MTIAADPTYGSSALCDESGALAFPRLGARRIVPLDCWRRAVSDDDVPTLPRVRVAEPALVHAACYHDGRAVATADTAAATATATAATAATAVTAAVTAIPNPQRAILLRLRGVLRRQRAVLRWRGLRLRWRGARTTVPAEVLRQR